MRVSFVPCCCCCCCCCPYVHNNNDCQISRLMPHALCLQSSGLGLRVKMTVGGFDLDVPISGCVFVGRRCVYIPHISLIEGHDRLISFGFNFQALAWVLTVEGERIQTRGSGSARGGGRNTRKSRPPIRSSALSDPGNSTHRQKQTLVP